MNQIINQHGTRFPTLGDGCQVVLGAPGSKAVAYRASLGGATLALLVWVEDSFRI